MSRTESEGKGKAEHCPQHRLTVTVMIQGVFYHCVSVSVLRHTAVVRSGKKKVEKAKTEADLGIGRKDGKRKLFLMEITVIPGLRDFPRHGHTAHLKQP